MDLYETPNKFKVQHKVNTLLKPSIGVLASPLAEGSLLLNDLSFVELFRHFSSIPYAEIVNSVPRSSKKTQVLKLDNFNMNFVDLNIYSKIDSSIRDDMLKQMLGYSLTRDDVVNSKPQQFPLPDNNDKFFQRDFSYSSWFENLVTINNQFINDSKVYNYINSIIGVIFVVSSEEVDIIQTVTNMEERVDKLLSDPQHRLNQLFHWSSKLLHRYYLVVYDNRSLRKASASHKRSSSNISTNSNVLDYMQAHFSGEGHFIEINSGSNETNYMKFVDSFYKNINFNGELIKTQKPLQSSESKKSFVDPLNVNSVSDHPLSNTPNPILQNSTINISTLSRIQRQLHFYSTNETHLAYVRQLKPFFYLNKGDLGKVSNFIMVYVTGSLIPFLFDLRIQIQQAVNMKMRGAKYFLNSAKEFFRSSKKYTQLPTSFLSSSSLTSLTSRNLIQASSNNNNQEHSVSNGDFKKNLQASYDSIFSAFSSVNALRKFQADITFILQDYNEAHNLYMQLYKDIDSNDSNECAIKITSMEMRLITSFYIDNTKNISLTQCDTIHNYYLKKNPSSHIRFCYLMSTILLGLNRCFDSCNILAGLLEGNPDEQIIPIILEQIGAIMYRYININKLFGITRIHRRKFAHYMLMAGQDYYKNKQFLHCHLCYQKAYNSYNGLNWPYLKCHIERNYVKSLFHLKCYNKILDVLRHHDFYNTQIDNTSQLVNLQFVLNLFQYFIEHFPALLESAEFVSLQPSNNINGSNITTTRLLFPPIKFTVNSIILMNENLQNVNSEQCDICNSNPRLKTNDHNSLYHHKNISFSHVCDSCSRDIFHATKIDEPLLNAAKTNLNVSSDDYYNISPPSCCYKDQSSSKYYTNVIDNKYRIYLDINHKFSVPIIISDIKVNWTFVPLDINFTKVINESNCTTYSQMIEMGENNFGGTICLNSGADSAQIFIEFIPHTPGHLTISSLCYKIFSINFASTIFHENRQEENTPVDSPRSDAFEYSPNYANFFNSSNNQLSFLFGSDGTQYRAMSVPTFFNSEKASIPENTDIFRDENQPTTIAQSLIRSTNNLTLANSNHMSNDSHAVNFEYKVRVECVSMCENKVTLHFHSTQNSLPIASIHRWKIKMFFKECCKAFLNIEHLIDINDKKNNNFYCFARIDSPCLEFDDSYGIISDNLFYDDSNNRYLMIAINNGNIELPLRMIYHSNLLMELLPTFFGTIHQTNLFVLLACKDDTAYFKNYKIPFYNVFMESVTANIHIHELDSCFYTGQSLDFSAFKYRVECTSKLTNTDTSIYSIVFNDLLLCSDKVDIESIALDTTLLHEEGQILNHLAMCYPRIVALKNANSQIKCGHQTLNPNFVETFERLLSNKTLFNCPYELKVLLLFQINLTKKSDDGLSENLENFTLDGYFLVGIDVPSELKLSWFVENSPRSSKVVLNDKLTSPCSLGFNVIMDNYQIKYSFNESDHDHSSLNPYYGTATLLLWNKLDLPLYVYIESHPDNTQSHFMWCGKAKFNVVLPPLHNGELSIKKFKLDFLVLKPGVYNIGNFIVALTTTEGVEPYTLPVTFALKRAIPIFLYD